MAATAGVRVEGGRELRRDLKRAAGDLNDLKDAHREVAGIVARTAGPEAPVSSGALAASVRPGATARAAIIRAGGASLPYAGPIHFGWPARNIEPDPFITEQAEATEPTWTDLYGDAVQRILDRIKGANT